MTGFAVHALAGYLLGAVPTGLWVGRWIGRLDIRSRGSHSTGATNVLRVLGWKPALAVALADVLKGFAAAAWVPGLGWGQTVDPGGAALAAGFGAIVGHVWPVSARFRGGKGVATAAGVVLAIHPGAALVSILAFAAAVAVTRRVAVGSILAALGLPVALHLVPGTASGIPRAVLLGYGAAVGALIVWAHRNNIRNLLAGNEPEIGS